MKKGLGTLIIAAALLVTGCKGSDNNPPPPGGVVGVTPTACPAGYILSGYTCVLAQPVCPPGQNCGMAKMESYLSILDNGLYRNYLKDHRICDINPWEGWGIGFSWNTGSANCGYFMGGAYLRVTSTSLIPRLNERVIIEIHSAKDGYSTFGRRVLTTTPAIFRPTNANQGFALQETDGYAYLVIKGNAPDLNREAIDIEISYKGRPMASGRLFPAQ